MNAIVYTSGTGFTAQYAELLGKETGLQVLSLENAVKTLEKKTEIVYLGWLMAGEVKGLSKAKKRFDVKVIGSVGMSSTDSQEKGIRERHLLDDSIPVFYLQGGFDFSKLKGMPRFMMKFMIKTVGKAIAAKESRTPDEEDMLKLMTEGGSRVSEKWLKPLVDCINSCK